MVCQKSVTEAFAAGRGMPSFVLYIHVTVRLP